MTAWADLLPGKTRAISRKSSKNAGQPGSVAFLVILRDDFAARTIARVLRRDLRRVLVPSLRGRDFTAPAHHRAAEQWCAAHLADGERPVLVALLEQGLLGDLDWLGLAAYVARPPGRRREERHSFSGARTLILPVLSLDEFASAIASHVLQSGAADATVPRSAPSAPARSPVRQHSIAAAPRRTDPVPGRTDPVPGRLDPPPKVGIVRVADTTGIVGATRLASSLFLADLQAACPPAAGTAAGQGHSPLTAVPPAGGAVITLGGSVFTPNGAQVTSGGDVITPGGYVIASDGTVTTPGDYVITAGGTLVTPNGTLVSNGTAAQPAGTTAGTAITAGGAALPDGTFIGSNGTTLPDGTFIDPDGTVLPDGTFIDPDGTTLTDGTTITSAGTTLGSDNPSALATPLTALAAPLTTPTSHLTTPAGSSSTPSTPSTPPVGATPSAPGSSDQSAVQQDIDEGSAASLDFWDYAARSPQARHMAWIPSGLGWPEQDSLDLRR
jgi:hypothetical protein